MSIHTKRKKIENTLYYAANIAVILLSWWLAYIIRKYISVSGAFGLKGLTTFENIYILVITSILIFPILLKVNRVFYEYRMKAYSSVFLGIFKCVIELIGFFILLSFVAGQFRYNRSLILTFGLSLLVLFSVKEYLIYSNQRRGAGKSAMVPAILIGKTEDIVYIMEKIKRENVGVRIEGAIYLNDTAKEGPRIIEGVPDLGGLEELSRILESHNVGLVVIVSYYSFENEVGKILFACEERGVEVWLRHRLFEREIAKVYSGNLADVPMLVFTSTPPYSWSLFAKRMFDLAFVLCFLPIFCILFILVGIGIKLSAPGPVLFKQKRGGLFGKPFTFLKFRTMYKDAEQRRNELERYNIMKGPVFKVKDDPRIFPFGKFLRKTSLDELPQIFNILAGDMSVVGPRPLPLVEVANVKGWHRRRFSMKPGLTCIWQVSGRNKITDFEEWVRMDLEYIDNWSPLLDAKLFIKTIWVVLSQQGSG